MTTKTEIEALTPSQYEDFRRRWLADNETQAARDLYNLLVGDRSVRGPVVALAASPATRSGCCGSEEYMRCRCGANCSCTCRECMC
jgi:hypothetical protein